MKISVEQNGGLTGIRRNLEIDTDNLKKSEAIKISKLVQNCHLDPIGGDVKHPPKGAADYISYKITIQDRSNHHVIECNEHNIQTNLKSLVGYIKSNSKKIK